MKLSVIVPSYKEPRLADTLDSLLYQSELGYDMEVIAVLDGYWPDPPLRNDDRLVLVHRSDNRGMRSAINSGVAIAKGQYIMRADSHCLFAKGYDRILTDNIQDNWIVTPRRYFLDTDNWKVMDTPYVDYMRLCVANYRRGKKFSGFPIERPNRENVLVDETMAWQGSCWIMARSWWDKVIGEMRVEGYGNNYQESHELSFSTWMAGGKLMVNKGTWFAHKHRKFKRASNYGGEDADRAFAYVLHVWREYFDRVIKPYQRKLYA